MSSWKLVPAGPNANVATPVGQGTQPSPLLVNKVPLPSRANASSPADATRQAGL